MPETTTEVRAEIEQTRARMSNTIAELERKAHLTEQIREHPWASVGVAFGAGLALSASNADVKAAQVTSDATRQTGNKLGTALDGVVATLIAAVTAAVHDRIDGAVDDVVTSIRGNAATKTSTRPITTSEPPVDLPIRAD